MLDIKEIIESCIEKEENAHQKLYDAMYPTIYNTCMRYAPNKSVGDDYMQDCYVKIFNNLEYFIGDTMGDLGCWVKKICINHCIDQVRGNKPLFCNYTEVGEISDDCITGDLNVEFTLHEMLDAIQKLTPRYKTIFNMFVLDGYSHAEITRELGLKPGTSKANLFKAKRKVRELLLATT